ncbi:MAG: SLBB domain-containing protein [Sediminibacterium sp. Gen4]|jgi:protein involved in polysaccharide export with SLBB domain|uniref:SLBB domain-containing protein n=1 Tax=unclassified Sediminibacterium TaxID=2635961 RepID=UPI0015B91801|nr:MULTISPECIES: SLBB domain-containing protein [unclassified Sediminibacterium]MBW0163351.1 SLBB domain-containing protein [Sediminibacterium sp.]NWK67488.1 SLBB domain-containing protein [Sediminibacterium sp. Gen4]
MKMIIRSLLVLVLMLGCATTWVGAQGLPVNIESLSDEQLIQLATKYNLMGLSESELEAKAKEAGLGSDQILMLKKRIALLDPSVAGGQLAYSNKTDSYVLRNKVLTKGPTIRSKDSSGVLQVFGAEIFDNLDLSFEPNLSIATPSQYIIGVNDQLVIDVYGVSDVTKKLKVTTEGDIRFPNLGPIKVAGLSVDDARAKIKKALTRIYPGIATGAVAVQVSVGQIRSIQITLLGEVRRPGTYTISALATLMNALYASGGPNDIGSFRTIELLRGGKVVTSFDLYDFLLKGDLSKNRLLQDDDVIRVGTYNRRVALKGALKKPAIFDMKAGETAADLVQYAGGFADLAFKERVRVTRLGSSGREVLTVPSSGLSTFQLQSGDTLVVDSLPALYANRVWVSGAVYHSGAYGLAQTQDLKTLLQLAGLREDAYQERGLLRRLKTDLTPSMVSFSVQEVLKGSFNLNLQREDSIHIFRATDLRERYTVEIDGEVNQPGRYDYFENMRVQDLVLLANGYREGAARQKIEISRRLSAGGDTISYAVIKDISLDNPQDLLFELKPFDMVSVRRLPVYKEQIKVSIEGEVLYPGTYTLSGKNERLSDIINRAGGLKSSAFAEGAVLIRNTYVGVTSSDASLVGSKARLINQQSGRNIVPVDGGDSTILKNLSAQQKPVSIRLADALGQKGSAADVFLEEGDIIKIPKSIQTIQTFGMVNLPKQIVYRDGLSFKEAVRASGGFAVNAARRHSYVVYANGEIRTTRNFLFFRSYPSLKTGSEIYVPSRSDKKKLTTGEAVAVVSGLTSFLGLLVVLINTAR